MAAEQATKLVNGKQATMISTRTIPQGISALLSLDPGGELADVLSAMEESSRFVESGEITTSTRDVTIDGMDVKEGQIIGLHNDVLKVAGDIINEVIFDLLDEMEAADLELITLYYGMDVSPQDADALAAAIEERYDEQEIEVREGGQPHYYYILSVE